MGIVNTERAEQSAMQDRYTPVAAGKTSRFIPSLWLLLLAACFALPCQAQTLNELMNEMVDEPPQVLEQLYEAMQLEQAQHNPDKIKRAITLYCSASRAGSLEAQYRFGLLYLAGDAVPKNLTFAATLFSQASQQGHRKAMNMLENVKLRQLELPACLL